MSSTKLRKRNNVLKEADAASGRKEKAKGTPKTVTSGSSTGRTAGVLLSIVLVAVGAVLYLV
jgi:hypothetical protein